MEGKTVQQRFVDAWGSVENPPLDCVNPHFKNRYASLKATLGEVRKACAPNGLAYVQSLVEADGGYSLASYVTDGSDNLPLSTFPMSIPPNPQAFGSELTYKKRQQAQADWGIVGEEDDDGEAGAKAAGPVTGKCKGCGSVWSLNSAAQARDAICPNCGAHGFEVV